MGKNESLRRRGDFGLRIPFPGVAFAAFFVERDPDEEIKK
jgi:hypothetical protein